jgi:phospholipid/cholesterol/gamma-HCH transport system substrate-binding protein
MSSDSWRERHADRRVGLFVLIALAVLLGAILQAGVLRNWLSPPEQLRVVLPEQGLSGLSPGAPVEILGTKAGEVRGIVINPDATFYADVQINRDMRDFIRRDSVAIIRKQFGVAGAAYLDILRGQGPPLDWDFAVIQATTDRPPTENVGQLVDDLRDRIIPLIEDSHRAIRAIADFAEQLRTPTGELQTMLHNLSIISDRLQKGEGAIGRLLGDGTMGRQLQATVAQANAIVAQIEHVARDVSAVSRTVNAQAQALPTIIANTDRALAATAQVMEELSRSSPAVAGVARNADAASANLPALLVQTQQTTLELERLLVQLRGLWVLGGSGGPEPPAGRLDASEARP